jgi:hypothetical protein
MHLSVALGIRACLAGHRVAFKTATEWVALRRTGAGRRQRELGSCLFAQSMVHIVTRGPDPLPGERVEPL